MRESAGRFAKIERGQEELADGGFWLALLDVARFHFAGLGFARLASFKTSLGGADLFAQAGGLDEEIVHRVTVVSVGFSVGEAALQLRAKILRALV